ncbi:MAG: flippase-like domain-containing protein [candidate division KSB1 bacterium]|nr:flippase-like domain-containing protein [candidate division KSB1 bacterium]MDZ7318265.1 flippase-like domain-containing protein [candidate division KSB1 bacterium]MDZ7340143.1 flippase-like domain-containing protein [candidate division KSB1 bacterium]
MFRRIGIPILKIGISSFLIGWLLVRLGPRDIFDRFLSANIWWILLAIIVFSLSNIFGALQWQLLMKTKSIHLPWSHVLAYYYVGLFFNNFLIGNVGGDAIRVYDIARLSGDLPHAISTVFFDRLIGFFVMTTLALLSGLFWHNIFQSNSLETITIIIFLLWVVSFVFLFNENLASRIGWLFRFMLTPKMNHKLRAVYQSINAFKHERRMLLTIGLISLLVQSLRVLVHYYAALSVGVQLHLKYFIIFIPVVALLSSLPISIGGIGIREGSAVAMFSQVNSLPPESIVAFEFLAYLIGLIATIPGGIFFILRREKFDA